MSQEPNVLDGAPRLSEPTDLAEHTRVDDDAAGGDVEKHTTPAPSETPELCGFKDRTTPFLCPSGLTCMFNTDIYAAACCSSESCYWGTTCCGYGLSETSRSTCGRGVSAIYW